MELVAYRWQTAGVAHTFRLVRVDGTHGDPFHFGTGPVIKLITVRTFYLGVVPVTQALWRHVVGTDWIPAANREDTHPVENVSWTDITRHDGFLDRLNRGAVREVIAAATHVPDGEFRLPTEAEWEYAARGGPAWRDGFRFSGSNDPDAVAWYDRRHGDHTQPVALKAPNQLGLYDMSGNVWEWCQDVFTEDVGALPTDGSAMAGTGSERSLRGGCFHNWAIHCTVSKRYQIDRDYRDGCIGVRLVFAAS